MSEANACAAVSPAAKKIAQAGGAPRHHHHRRGIGLRRQPSARLVPVVVIEPLPIFPTAAMMNPEMASMFHEATRHFYESMMVGTGLSKLAITDGGGGSGGQSLLSNNEFARITIVQRGEKEVLFRCMVPGYTMDELKVDVQDDSLIISGERKVVEGEEANTDTDGGQPKEGESNKPEEGGAPVRRTAGPPKKFARRLPLPDYIIKESFSCSFNEEKHELEVLAEVKLPEEGPKVNIPINIKPAGDSAPAVDGGSQE